MINAPDIIFPNNALALFLNNHKEWKHVYKLQQQCEEINQNVIVQILHIRQILYNIYSPQIHHI